MSVPTNVTSRRLQMLEKASVVGAWISALFSVAFFFGITNNIYQAWDTARNDPSCQSWGKRLPIGHQRS